MTKSIEQAEKVTRFCNSICVISKLPLVFKIDRFHKAIGDYSKVEIIIPRRIFKDNVIGSFTVNTAGKRYYGPIHSPFYKYYDRIVEILNLYDTMIGHN